MANSIIYSGGEGSWSNTIIYSGPITSANIVYNNKNNWTKYNSINVPNNRVGGVQYTNKWANINNNLLKIRAIYNLKNINKWANGILNLINKWANNILKLLNKWANINTLNNKVGGPINNLKNNWTIKYIKGAIKYINNKIKWAKYNLKNINNKGIRIGPTHNIKLNNLINKMDH